MSKHTINGFITYRDSPYTEKPEVQFLTYDPRQYDKDEKYPRIVLREHSFEIEVADDFDPRPGMIESLKQTQAELRAEFIKRVTDIERRIGELQAISYNVV